MIFFVFSGLRDITSFLMQECDRSCHWLPQSPYHALLHQTWRSTPAAHRDTQQVHTEKKISPNTVTLAHTSQAYWQRERRPWQVHTRRPPESSCQRRGSCSKSNVRSTAAPLRFCLQRRN